MTNFQFFKFSKMVCLYSGLTIVLFTNCSKQNSNTDSGYWTIGGPQKTDRYNINYTSRLDSFGYSVLKGNDNPPSSTNPTSNSIFIWFPKGFPVKNGSYAMVNLHYPPYTLSDSQIGISGRLTSNSFYHCADNDTSVFDATNVADRSTWPFTLSGNAEVTVTNGKIGVKIPQTIAVELRTCGLDSPFLNLQYQEK